MLVTVFADHSEAAVSSEETKTGDVSVEAEPDTFGLYLENDYFAHSDGGYTSGLKLSWSSGLHDEYPQYAWPHRWLYPLIKHIPFEKKPDLKRNITFALGQNIFTPEDIDSEEVVEDDRPYAGVTYLSMGFHTRKDRSMDSVEMLLGLVGPSSGAEECQKAVHRVFDDIQPNGWDNQLNNEAIIDLVYEHKKKIKRPDPNGGFGYDVILNTGGGIGNALTFYNLGLMFRTGWNIPNDFGIMPIRPISSFNGAMAHSGSGIASDLGVQFFVSIEGRAVFQNIFLDGNTFTDSHSVDKKPMVGDLMTGVNVNMGRGQLSFALVKRSKEFETQNEPQEFASINLSYAY